MSGKGLQANQFNGLVGGGGIVTQLLAGEDFDVTGNAGVPFAAYPKIKKTLEFSASDNILSTSQGSITITAGTKHVYPYTALKSEMETKLNLLGSAVFTVTLEEEHFKIETVATNFTIDKLVANSATTKLGFVAVDTSILKTFFRADSIHTFSNFIYLFKTNTTDDATPPLEGAVPHNPVDADHRSRSFSGFVIKDVTAGNQIDLFTSGEITGFIGLIPSQIYRTNGTAGELSLTSIANSLDAGPAKADAVTLVLDPSLKGFEFQIEPDTDFAFDTSDGILDWESVPEIPLFMQVESGSANVKMHSCGVDGDNVVQAVVGSDLIKIVYSTDVGKSYKMATFEDKAGLKAFPPTRQSGVWNDTNDYYNFAPSVIVDGNKVFVAYVDEQSPRFRIKGFYGVIDSNGNLDMKQTNEFKGGSFVNTISNTASGLDRSSIQASFKNGVIYLTYYVIGSSNDIIIVKSSNNGATFTDEVAIGNVGVGVGVSQGGLRDVPPHQLAITDVPGQTISPSELLTNGDFGTGDLTGWTVSSGTVDVVANAAIIRGAANGEMHQDLTTIIGKTYKVDFDVLDDAPELSYIQVTNGTGTAGADLGIISRTGEGSFSLVFTAISTTSNIRVNRATGTSDWTVDNISIKENAANRVSVVTASLVTGGTAANQTNLLHTDDQDLTANWAAGQQIGNNLLGSAHYQPIGAYLDVATDKWYIHHITGNTTVNGTGGLARTGSVNLIMATEIDLSAVTPTILQGTVDIGASINTSHGSSANNSNSNAYANSPNNIIKTDDGVMTAISTDGGDGFVVLIQDISDVTNTTQIIENNRYESLPGNSLITEQQFGMHSSSLQLVYKRNFDTFGASLTLGKILAQELNVDITAKPELITNGTFDTDISGWTVRAGTGNSFDAGTLKQIGDGSTPQIYQEETVESGKTYTLSVEITNVGGSATPAVRYWDGPESEAPASAGVWPVLFTGIGVGVHKTSIKPTGSTITLHFSQNNIGAGDIVNWDNISLKEAFVQPALEKDIIDKPNVDEEGYAGRLQVISQDQIMHLAAEAAKIVEGSLVETLVTNNHGLKVIDVEETFSRYPTETEDSQGADTTIYTFGASPSGQYQARVLSKTGITEYFIATSADFGDTWDTSSLSLDQPVGLNNTTHRLIYSPKIIVEDDGAFVSLTRGVGDVNSQKGSINTDGKVDSLSETLSIFATAGDEANFGLEKSGTKVVAFEIESSNVGVINVSSDSGATWAGQINVADGTSPEDSISSAYFIVPNGGGHRIGMISAITISEFTLHYTDDDGASWETAINLHPANASRLMGFALDGVKLAMIVADSTNTNAVYLISTLDIVNGGAAPVFSTPTRIDDNIGVVDLEHGGTSGNVSMANYKLVAKTNGAKIRWTGATSIEAVYDRTNGSERETVLSTVADVSTPAVNVQSEAFSGPSGISYQESQFLVSESGRRFIVTKQVEEASIGSNESRGRILSKEILVGGFGPEIDVANKSTIPGFAGHIEVSNNVAAFEKDNGKAFEGVFANVVRERQVNEEVEEFRQVPVKLTSDVTDVITHAVTQSPNGQFIITTSTPAGSLITLAVSIDRGKNWIYNTFLNDSIPAKGSTSYYTQSVDIIIDDNGDFIGGYRASGGNHKAFHGTVSSTGAISVVDDGTIDGGSHQTQRVVRRGSTVVHYGNAANVGSIIVSTDSGLSYGSPIGIKDNVTLANIQDESPLFIGITDNGSGGDRVHIVGTHGSSPFDIYYWSTDDRGATWNPKVSISNLPIDDLCMGFGFQGNKLALTVRRGDANTVLQLITTTDLNNAAGPTWSTSVAIADGLGNMDEYNGDSTASTTQASFNRKSLNNILWTSDTSLLIGWNRAGSVSHDVVVAKIEDISNVAGSTSYAVLEGTGTEIYQESGQLLQADSGDIYVITGETSSNRTNNITSGRVFALKVMNPSGASVMSLGPLQDIGFKPSVSIGGFSGRFEVSGNIIIFEKEDGGSLEQLYFNSIENRRVQKGE